MTEILIAQVKMTVAQRVIPAVLGFPVTHVY